MPFGMYLENLVIKFPNNDNDFLTLINDSSNNWLQKKEEEEEEGEEKRIFLFLSFLCLYSSPIKLL